MALRYRLYGGASRPDAVSGLQPDFAQRLEALYEAAPPEVQAELGLNSAYRSIARQQELWDASDKTGRTVARPGQSHHNKGDAVDLYGFGLGGHRLDLVSQATRDWVEKNLAAHGLYRPMDYEPWHVQPVANWAGGGGGGDAAVATSAGQQMLKAGYSPEQIRTAFLSSIAQGESPGYDVMYGGKKFTDYSRHPHLAQTANGITSDVAGRYQFKGSTWDELQKKYGYKDFSAPNQDAAAWQYAQDIYKQKAGGSLEEALSSGDPARVNAAAQVLNQTWSSLPGGKEQSKGYGSKTFADVFKGYLGQGGSTPEATDAGGHVRHPPNPKVGSMEDAKTLIASGQMAPVPAKQDDDEPPAWGRRIADALGGMSSPWGGGAMAGGGGVPRLPAYAPTPAEPAPIVAPSMADESRRNMLAALMQKYWVG